MPQLFVEYMCISCELALSRKFFPLGGGVVPISDTLLEGGLTLKTYLKKGKGGLKSENFRWDVIYGWPLKLTFGKNENISFS